jgi:hypothetical protein
VENAEAALVGAELAAVRPDPLADRIRELVLIAGELEDTARPRAVQTERMEWRGMLAKQAHGT